jgi:molybdate transport system substrate-binding protein
MRSTWLAIAITVVSSGALIGHADPKPITVSAAASLTDALTAIGKDYGSHGMGSIHFNFAASNVLARQITGGAPVDVFISADEAQMDVVGSAGMIKDGTRVALLRNQLAVIVPNDRPRTLRSFREIADPAFKRIALGDPEAVPAGVYAKQYLQSQGLWDAVKDRVVPAGSVRAALAAVETGAADAGIVYRTDARIALKATVAWVVPADQGPRIVYPAAIVKTTSAPDEAQRFLEYLRGGNAAAAFEQFGFSVIK